MRIRLTQIQIIAVPLLPHIIYIRLVLMKFRLALALVFLAAITRLLPHPPNFAPIAAMGLFGATYFSHRWMSVAAPLVALFLSDLFLNNVIYPQYFNGFTLITSWWIYAAFMMVIALGWVTLRGKKFSMAKTTGIALAASLTFFLVTNFGHWAAFDMYPKTPAGLLTCYVAGLPFLKNGILGDLVFSVVLFGVYEYLIVQQSTKSSQSTKSPQ